MKPNKVETKPTSPQAEALKRAAAGDSPAFFCEICEEREKPQDAQEEKKKKKKGREEKEEEKKPRITDIYWIDEKRGLHKLSELTEGREVTLCIEVEEGEMVETVDVKINTDENHKFKGGKLELEYLGVEVENDNTAYIDHFKIEYLTMSDLEYLTMGDSERKIFVSARISGSSDVVKTEIRISDYITDVFWADENNNKITLPPYNKNTVRVVFKLNESTDKNSVQLNVYAINTVTSKKIQVYENNCSTGEAFVEIELTGEMFKKGASVLEDEELIQNLFFEITVNGVKYSTEKKGKDYLRFHYIRFIPQILENQQWTHAKRMQDLWFSSPQNSKPWEHEPKLNFLDINWIKGFERMEDAIEEFKANLFTDNSKKLLLKRITLMINNNDLKLPDEGRWIDFGIDSHKLVEVHVKQPKIEQMVMEKIPLFEKYYFQSKPYNISKNIFSPEPLDDCFGTVAACQLRAIAFGRITRRKDPKIPNLSIMMNSNTKKVYLDIEITTVKIYIKDSFDYIDDTEKLGVWDATGNNINLLFGPGYMIRNKFFNDWKEDYNTGGDFQWYSTLESYATYTIYRNCDVDILVKD
jgi:hypothetical protein